MISTGILLRVIGAAILLVAVQFATLTAQAHAGLSHVPDGHALHEHGAAFSFHQTTTHAAQAQLTVQAATAVPNAGIATASSDACVIGCCGAGMGCCGAALASVSPNLPPKVRSPRIGFARGISVREADPRGLRKPPRSLA
jgi:hypothetical protein